MAHWADDLMSYTWDSRTSRYRDGETGRFVSHDDLHAEVVRVADASGARLSGLGQRLQSGSLSLADFQAQAMAEIKTANVMSALAAHGGRQAMAPADWLWVARDVKSQYDYLGQWVADIASGAAPIDGRLATRAALYGRHAVSTFVNMQTRDAVNSGAQMDEHWRTSSKDPCTGCPGQEARGWVPLGSLPPIGSQPCGANCACSKSFRRHVVEVAAA